MTAILQKAAEPSMEEILASIRRIIADDQTRVKPAPVNSLPASQSYEAAARMAAPREARLESATVEAFPAASKAAQPLDDGPSDAVDEADDGEAVALASDSTGSPEAALEGPAAAANDARYFPPEAEFQSAPRERLNGRERAFASAIEPDANSIARIESVARPRRDDIERGDLAATRSTTPYAPVSSDEVAVVPKLVAQPSKYRPAFDGGAGSPPDLSATAPAVAQQDHNRKGMLSGEADVAIGRAFDTLRHAVLSDNARTLDDLVKDMLRPMLKGWLDDNLPPLVERLVRAEIERVARGRPA